MSDLNKMKSNGTSLGIMWSTLDLDAANSIETSSAGWWLGFSGDEYGRKGDKFGQTSGMLLEENLKSFQKV